MRRKMMFVFAFLGVISAIWATKRAMMSPDKPLPKVEPASKPYLAGIAASGIIEAFGENYSVDACEGGIIQRVFVDVGQQVQKGQELFQLDDRALNADLFLSEAKWAVALVEHKRVQDQLLRLQKIKDPRAISQEELQSKENEERIFLARLNQMKMEKEKIKTLIDRLVVRSPIEGVVLKKNIKEGEYVAAGNKETSPLVIGNMSCLQVRASVDEQNALRIKENVPATAFPKNRPDLAIPLTFIRVEPCVIPKVSLTGSSKEKVDTRVLQVIYTFDPPTDACLYVGQQVDIYIERK